jgi:hypothetical protein
MDQGAVGPKYPTVRMVKIRERRRIKLYVEPGPLEANLPQ